MQALRSDDRVVPSEEYKMRSIHCHHCTKTMGFQDALYIRKTPYASEEAVEFADNSMEMISYYAIKSSSDL